MVSPETVLSLDAVLELISRSLFQINENLAQHCERTAFIAVQLSRALEVKEPVNTQKLYLLSLLHTIGFFRHDPKNLTKPMPSPEEIFNDVNQANDSFLYTQCYLKHMTTLGPIVEILKYHHQPFDESFYDSDPDYILANLLLFSSRIAAFTFDGDFKFEYFQEQFLQRDFIEFISGDFCDPKLIDTFMKVNNQNMIIASILDKSYEFKNKLYQQVIVYSDEEKFTLLKLLIYLMDLKSTFTLNHIIKTACFALSLAYRLKISQDELNTLFMGALLHDIGKLKTPSYILEGAGRLENGEMTIMKAHVNHSKRILQGVVPKSIMENAWHHHEKINGKGYPQGLSGENLNTIDRIITIADVASALSERRSYKEGFSKEKVLEIMEQDATSGSIDPFIFNVLKENYDDIKDDFPEIQEIMSTNFGMVMAEYFSRMDEITETLDEVEELEELEEL